MINEIKDTLRSISTFNLIILIFILNCGFVIDIKYIFITILGLLVGMINLYLRAIMLSRLAGNSIPKISVTYFAGYTLRIGFTALAGGMLFTVDRYYLLAYTTGYILHFSGIILYGFKLNLPEGK
ncbi:MAG: ATP synthase subunit I [Bacillota bacterium]|nr:ATP synthase subunit I [Bacillota bacterium]